MRNEGNHYLQNKMIHSILNSMNKHLGLDQRMNEEYHEETEWYQIKKET